MVSSSGDKVYYAYDARERLQYTTNEHYLSNGLRKVRLKLQLL